MYRLPFPCHPFAMHVLIVDDETKLSAYLASGLESEGWTVEIAADGLAGLQLALDGSHDAVVLDRMLPGLDGLAVLRALRSRKRTPVLMLTALGAVDDRVEGLRAGADDYLVKPFSFSELLARLQAIERRAQELPGTGRGDDPGPMTLADLEVDHAARRATRGGRRLELTAKEFRLLALLLRRKGKVLSRGELADRVWNMNFDGDTNVVEVAIRRLRIKLDVPFEKKLLHTVRGMGYVLEDRGT